MKDIIVDILTAMQRKPSNQDIRTAFAQRLRVERLKKNLSVDELARKSGVVRAHIYALEDERNLKRVTITTLAKLAKALGIPAGKLLN